ncbi:MAG: response regulator [Bacteroidaceae bacterium]|nr:response regulator [Bacteroidaceae bacterium]
MIQAHILVIDDNILVLRSLQLVLKNYFSTVAAVSDPQLIPAIIKEGNVDVVLLDMNFSKGAMDGADGIFWLNRIKRHSHLAYPPSVVLITAFSDVSLAVNSMKEGADDFIQKPWDNTHLVQKIAEAIAKRRETMHLVTANPLADDAHHPSDTAPQQTPSGKSLEEMELEHIRQVVASHGGNMTAAAKALGISRSTLYNKLKR